MENDALTRVQENPNEFSLTYTVQALKHHFAKIKHVFPVRFDVNYLPKVSGYQVTKVVFADGRWRITVDQGEFYGVRGVIPRTFYSESLTHWFTHNDGALITFFNGFNNRYQHFHYLCEAKHSLPLQAEEEVFGWAHEEKGLSHRLTKLFGDLSEGMPKDRQWLQYTGLLTTRTLCIFGLEAIVHDYFGYDCEVQNLSAHYQPVQREDCSRLGQPGQKSANNQLGLDLFAGQSAAVFSQFLDIHLKPKTAAELEELRLDPHLEDAIYNLVYRYLHSTVQVRLYIAVSSKLLPRLQLLPSAISLGFSSWLKAVNETESRTVVFPYKADLAAISTGTTAML